MSLSNWLTAKEKMEPWVAFSHKVVLAGNSAYFRDLLRSPRFRNEKRILVEVPDVSSAYQLLHWMYTRELTPPDYLTSMADMWSIMELSEFNSPEFSDVILDLVDPTGNERTLFSHKVILAGYSEFFRRLFLAQFREVGQRRINLEVPDVNMAMDLIQWMYTRGNPIPFENTIPLAIMWLVVEAEPEIPYPLVGSVGSVFVRDPTMGNWKKGDIDESLRRIYGKTLNRTVGYKSRGFHTIYSFNIYGFADGTIQVRIDLPMNYINKFEAYLRQYSLNLDTRQKDIGILSNKLGDLESAKALAEIVLNNNTFSPEDRKFINSIFGNTLDID